MRKTNVAIYAAAALGLCLMSPNGASAFPAADGAGKAYTQTVTGKNAVVPVRWGGAMAVGAAGVGEAAAMALDAASDGAVQAGAVAMALDAARMARCRWRGGYYGGYGGYGGYGLGLGWGWPLGLGLGVGAAATDWGWGGILATTVVAITRRITVAAAAVGSTQNRLKGPATGPFSLQPLFQSRLMPGNARSDMRSPECRRLPASRLMRRWI